MSRVRNGAQRKPSEYYEGPAIEHCPTFSRLIEDARIGSFRLKLAIENAGLRP